jgi:hypothetical protein
MAEEVQIAGTQSKAKIRSPWAPALLPIITLGIYYWVWYYRINREMADLGRARGKTDELGDSPGTSLLAVTLGIIPLAIPFFISNYHTAKRIQAAQRLGGVEPQLNGWLALVMYLVISPVFFAYEQSELNKVWRTPQGATPAITPAETAQPPAPPAPPAEPAAPAADAPSESEPPAA